MRHINHTPCGSARPLLHSCRRYVEHPHRQKAVRRYNMSRQQNGIAVTPSGQGSFRAVESRDRRKRAVAWRSIRRPPIWDQPSNYPQSHDLVLEVCPVGKTPATVAESNGRFEREFLRASVREDAMQRTVQVERLLAMCARHYPEIAKYSRQF